MAKAHVGLKAEGAASLIVDTRRNWDRPLTHDLLGAWQTMAVPETLSSLAMRGFEGGMSTKKYMAITKCSATTTTRDLAALCAMGAMVSRGAGRGTRYEISHAPPTPEAQRGLAR